MRPYDLVLGMIALELMQEADHIVVRVLEDAILIQQMHGDRILMMTAAVM